MPARPDLTPEISPITQRLVLELRRVLGDQLRAVYLFGSATTGDFEPGISDVDLVAVLEGDPTDEQISALASLHQRLSQEEPTWNDRIEVNYLSARALAEFRSHPWPAARISPGEPFHRIEIDRRWVLDWYQVRETGVALYGLSPHKLVPPISRAEVVEAIKEQLKELPDRISSNASGDALSYAVLTACRALRACATGEFVSKKQAAAWASEQLPEFQEVISDSVAWRYGARNEIDHKAARGLAEVILQLCERGQTTGNITQS